MLKVQRKRDIWRLVVVVTLFALTIVTSVLLSLYPREQWLWEITISWPLTTFLTASATSLIGRQMLRIHRLNEELTRIVSRDRLTDVATRDFFFKRMEENPDAYGMSLMIDIDHFKIVNDTYGHLTGDRVIAQVAAVLERETRPNDIVCRFGGEEFVVFLAQADLTRGTEVAERLRARISETIIDADDLPLQVTVSVGGSLKDATEHIDASIRRADLALYRAKREGRNRIHMFPRPNDNRPARAA